MLLDEGMRNVENDFPRPGIVDSPGTHSGNGQLTTSPSYRKTFPKPLLIPYISDANHLPKTPYTLLHVHTTTQATHTYTHTHAQDVTRTDTN